MIFRLKQYIKMLLQNVLLPILYNIYRRRPIRKGSVIFADAHHDTMPFSMRRMYEEVCVLEEQGKCSTELFLADFGKLSFGAMVKYLLRFMKQFATAEYVFICDYFLPASSCRKRQETKLIQLWHSCGLMKKIAFDTGEDIPKNYRGNMFGNYSLLTMSAEVCVPVHARALRIPEERICATGISRTDYYFDVSWNQRCTEQFWSCHPEAAGKKVAVWAPTFRGNAAMPYLEGLEEIRSAAELLKDEWYFIIKAHPHVDAHGKVSNSEIPTEELFPVTDLLITDYSSVLFDYLLYKKPAVLFAPDLEKYRENRGFYLDYETVPFPQTQSLESLTDAVKSCGQWQTDHEKEMEAFRKLYVGSCDGGATQRILKRSGMVK